MMHLAKAAIIFAAMSVAVAGNLVYSPDGGLVSFGEFDYVYDSASRLTEVWSNGVKVVENQYDALGRRVIKRTPEETHTFVYDGWLLVVERIERAGGQIEQIDYWWGKDISGSLYDAGGIGGLLYLRKNGLEVYVPLYDGHGNVIQYVDKHGSLVAEYTYDAFGNTIRKSGVKADELKMRFSTKYHDDESGLYYFGRRFYSPRLARWLSRDPIEEEGGLNLYAFCKNNTLLRYDKNGCAHFEVRRLSRTPGILKYSYFVPMIGLVPALILDCGVADKANIEILHEHLFYDDGTNVGYGSNGEFSEKDRRGYIRRDKREYDDCIMKEAQKRIPKPKYSLLGFGNASKFNCQDYADNLRREYDKIKNSREIKCKCRKRR